jgi:hypothetical protein
MQQAAHLSEHANHQKIPDADVRLRVRSVGWRYQDVQCVEL